MSLQLRYTTLDVFTTTRFLGNPLAIVHVPRSTTLSQTQKQTIAREFNFSETVFLHEAATDSDSTITVDIFTTTDELPFAGHPSVGSGWYLLSQNPKIETITLRTKAGDIPVHRDSKGVRLQVPIDFKIHEPFAHPTLKSSQPLLKGEDYVLGAGAAEPTVSIVKGMTFILLQLASEDALGRLQLFPGALSIPPEHLGEWSGFSALYAFVQKQDGSIRTRMMEGTFEDPATGSAASTLGGYLATQKGPGKWMFEMTQGVEIGRRSEIAVVAEVDSTGELVRVELAGSAVEVMEGFLNI